MRRSAGVVPRIALVASLVAVGVLAAGSMAAAEPGFAPVQVLQVPAGSDAEYFTLTCTSSTSCTAIGGEYAPGGGVLVDTQSSGTWGAPTVIPLAAGVRPWSASAISCATAVDCLVVGSVESARDGVEPLVVAENSGEWGTAASMALPAGALSGTRQYAALTGVWCAAAGTCEAVGFYRTASDVAGVPMAAVETAGVWSPATTLPVVGDASYGDQVSLECTSAGNCMAVADTEAWTQTDGTWGPPTLLPQPRAPQWTFLAASVACPSSTTCIAVGSEVYEYGADGSSGEAAAVTETDGTWGDPTTLPGSALTSISCAPSVCVAVGVDQSLSDFDPYTDPLALTWSGGTWSTPGYEPFQPAQAGDTDASWFGAVSCPTAAQCVGVGSAGIYRNGNGPESRYPYATDLVPDRTVVAPAPPDAVSATPTVGGAQVEWQGVPDDGGAPLTSYTATAHPGGATCSGITGGCALTGLSNGHQYVVTVTDTNGTFSSPRAFTNHFFAGAAPSTPADLLAYPTGKVATIRWHASTSPVGEPVQRYLVDVRFDGATHLACVTTRDRCALAHLVKGDAYAVTVVAVDPTGASAPTRAQFFFFPS